MMKDVQQRLKITEEVEVVVYSLEDMDEPRAVESLVQRGKMEMVLLVPDQPQKPLWAEVQRFAVRRHYYAPQARLFHGKTPVGYWALFLDWSESGQKKAAVESKKWMERGDDEVPRWSTRASRRRSRRRREWAEE